MKYIFLGLVFFAILFTCFFSFGQIEQGTFVINERFNFSTTTSENDISNYQNKQTIFNTTTSFGYLFKENHEVGISLLFGINKISIQEDGSNNDATRTNYGFDIYYKRYINIMDKLSFFIAPKVDYLTMRQENFSSNRNQIGASIYTGLLYHPTKSFGLSMNIVGAGLNYSYQKQTNLRQNSFSLSNYGGLNLGIQFMF